MRLGGRLVAWLMFIGSWLLLTAAVFLIVLLIDAVR